MAMEGLAHGFAVDVCGRARNDRFSRGSHQIVSCSFSDPSCVQHWSDCMQSLPRRIDMPQLECDGRLGLR